jgi:hypothetical protein
LQQVLQRGQIQITTPRLIPAQRLGGEAQQPSGCPSGRRQRASRGTIAADE